MPLLWAALAAKLFVFRQCFRAIFMQNMFYLLSTVSPKVEHTKIDSGSVHQKSVGAGAQHRQHREHSIGRNHHHSANHKPDIAIRVNAATLAEVSFALSHGVDSIPAEQPWSLTTELMPTICDHLNA